MYQQVFNFWPFLKGSFYWNLVDIERHTYCGHSRRTLQYHLANTFCFLARRPSWDPARSNLGVVGLELGLVLGLELELGLGFGLRKMGFGTTTVPYIHLSMNT